MKVITIGRGYENDVNINDPTASRHHLQIIQHDDGHFTLSDFGSTNGTFVNGQKISGEIPLNDMDVVRIGNTTVPWRMYFEDTYTPQNNPQPQEQYQPQYDGRPQNFHPQYDSQPPAVSNTGNNADVVVEKKRHGFVTFWLWFMIVVSTLSTINNVIFVPGQTSKNIDYVYETLKQNPDFFEVDESMLSAFRDSTNTKVDIMFICGLIAWIGSLVFVILILRWKKIGFWGYAILGIIMSIFNFIMKKQLLNDFASVNLPVEMGGEKLLLFATSLIGILVLWAILQIRKDGVSCWKQLK